MWIFPLCPLRPLWFRFPSVRPPCKFLHLVHPEVIGVVSLDLPRSPLSVIPGPALVTGRNSISPRSAHDAEELFAPTLLFRCCMPILRRSELRRSLRSSGERHLQLSG